MVKFVEGNISYDILGREKYNNCEVTEFCHLNIMCRNIHVFRNIAVYLFGQISKICLIRSLQIPTPCWIRFRPRSHVSGYFRIRNFFFPDTATVHTHPANSTANPEKNKSALQSGKK